MSSTQHLTDNDGGERDDQLVFDRRIRLSIYYRFCAFSSVLIGDLTFSFFVYPATCCRDVLIY